MKKINSRARCVPLMCKIYLKHQWEEYRQCTWLRLNLRKLFFHQIFQREMIYIVDIRDKMKHSFVIQERCANIYTKHSFPHTRLLVYDNVLWDFLQLSSYFQTPKLFQAITFTMHFKITISSTSLKISETLCGHVIRECMYTLWDFPWNPSHPEIPCFLAWYFSMGKILIESI